MSNERIDEDRELALYYTVFSTEEAQELLGLWIDDILNTGHFQPQIDPNNMKTIRDMAVLEFIQGIKNRVQEFLEKGVKNGPTKSNNIINTNEQPANEYGNDTGHPSI